MKKILLLMCALLVAFGIHAQNVTVSGTVTSAEDNSPLPGVSVVLKGSTSGVGAATDAEGKYSLSVPSTDGVLVFSYIGFKTQEVQISGRTTVDFSMEPAQHSFQKLLYRPWVLSVTQKISCTLTRPLLRKICCQLRIRIPLKPCVVKQPVFGCLPVQVRLVLQRVSYFAVKVH